MVFVPISPGKKCRQKWFLGYKLALAIEEYFKFSLIFLISIYHREN